MPNKSSVLITGARQIDDFVLVARNPERLDYFSKQILDEMLVAMPRATVRNLWDIVLAPVEQLTDKIGSPFGDW